MARSRTVSNADGATHLFPVSFPLPPQQGRLGVNVYVHPATDPHPGNPISTSAFTWVSDGQINITAAPAGGNVVDIRRATLDTTLDNTVQAGGSLRAQDLVQNDTQLLYLIQEREDTDTDLQSQLDVETAARIAADTAESATRLAADTAETTARISADVAEATTRAAADVAEASARANAITAEATTRANADNALASAAGALTTRVSAVEGRTGTVIVNSLPYDVSAYPLPVLSPEQFGAQHSVLVDDGPALHAMSVALNILGGGTIWMDPAQTYWVGGQTHNGAIPQGGTYTWAPTTSYPIEVSGTTRGVKIMGNGASIKCLAGGKYGTFDDAGVAMATGNNYFGTGISTPYQAMVYVHGCSGSVEIENLELDGNIAAQNIGGQWGDAGRQIHMTGLTLENNTGSFTGRNLNSHSHGLDGLTGDGPGLLHTREAVVISASTFTGNGRQGASLVGGNGWAFLGCKFNHTGDSLGALTYSPPGAGVDLEAEGGKYVTNIRFADCEFAQNTGPGLIADTSANTFGITCENCTFIGTKSWAIWPNRPFMRFVDCTVLGAIVSCHQNDNFAAESCRFVRCRFPCDPAYSPTGNFYNDGLSFGGGGVARTIDPGLGIPIFEECEFGETTSTGLNIVYGTFDTCSFTATVNTAIQARGTFYGRNTFTNCGSLPRQDLAATLFLIYAGPSYDPFIFNGTLYQPDTDRITGKKLTYGIVAPTTLTWAKGDRCINTDPDSGEPIGWVCTVAGTPGTWKAYGTIA